MTGSTAADRWKQVDFAVRIQDHEFRGMVDLAVDSDADRVELRGYRRKSFDEAAQQFVDAWRIDGNLGHATGRGGPAAGQKHNRHVVVRMFGSAPRRA